MLSWIKKLFVNKYARSLARTILAGAGGLLLGIGLGEQEVAEFLKASEPVLYGLFVWASAQLMSLMDKKKNQD